MDFKDELNNIQNSIGNDFKKLTNILDVHLATIPEEVMKEVAPIRADIQRVLNSVKSGDTEAINEITKKYGDSNR